ncbi:MAG: vanadium-dependent haloperoxidase [Marinicella sp.]
MKNTTRTFYQLIWIQAMLLCSGMAGADVITDWNVTARDIVVESKLYTPPANRVMALVHTSIYQAVNNITQEYPNNGIKLKSNAQQSINAAVAAASYYSLMSLLPQQKPVIENAYKRSLALIPDDDAKIAGIEIGQQAAHNVLLSRKNDKVTWPDNYRPHTTAGAYVPTVIPAVPHWPKRQPWYLSSAAQFRPGPPTDLNSEQWVKDFNEVKTIGAIDSQVRTAEQTKIAKFWEATLPPIYHGVVHSVATQKGRSVTQNARLFALITQATDDAIIAVFDAKYHYGFWRPITAIRNADLDANDATVLDSEWAPFIPTPMHPEYPCAHCVVAATVGAIIKAEVGNGPLPVLSTHSVTAQGAKRSWNTIDAFIQEVSEARIYDGVHYRYSTEVGSDMGKLIGELVISKNLNQ